MDIINHYLDDLIFIKVDRREDYAIYAAAINSSLGNGKKQYIIISVPNHIALKERSKIVDLVDWKSVQTRTLTNGYKIQSQNWRMPRSNVPIPMFNMSNRTQTYTKYTLEEHPEVEMVLLHDPKKKSNLQYYNRINLVAALATFNCVISLNTPTVMHPARAPAPALAHDPYRIPALATPMPQPKMAYTPSHDNRRLSSVDDPRSLGPESEARATGFQSDDVPKEKDSYLPEGFSCNSKYCVYGKLGDLGQTLAPDASSAPPVQGYQVMPSLTYTFPETKSYQDHRSKMSNNANDFEGRREARPGIDASFEFL